MKRKIVILGDSIVMPCPYMDEVGKTEYEDTYGYLLSRAFGDHVSVCFVGGLDTEMALEGWNEQYVAFKRMFGWFKNKKLLKTDQFSVSGDDSNINECI